MSLDVNISEPDEFNCVELHNCIKSVADIKHICDFTYHVDIVSGKGENYIANVFRVSIQETGSDKNISVIVKTLVNTTRQELFSELHKREVFAYKQIIDNFVILQNDISIDNRIVLPECIFSSVEKNNEVIILEDLLLNNFVSNTKIAQLESLDYPQVHLIITELAKFHGLTFVFEKKNKYFDTVQNDFEDLLFNENFLNNTRLKDYFSDSFQISVNLIDDNDVKNKLEQKKEKILDILRTFTKPRKYNVFCHGDCWINNILFKEDSKKQICFLDFQAMRYASPVTDILYFLYICTDSVFRLKYFSDLIKEYYDTLNSFLKLFEIDAFEVYPKDEFEDEVNEMLPFGLLVALLELKLVTTSPENIMSRESLNIPEFEDIIDVPDIIDDKLYQVRVNDVINESINNGVLDRLLYLLN